MDRADIDVRGWLSSEERYPQSAFDSVVDTSDGSETLAQPLYVLVHIPPPRWSEICG